MSRAGWRAAPALAGALALAAALAAPAPLRGAVSAPDGVRFSADGDTVVVLDAAATRKAAFRAFDAVSGKPVWSLPLDLLRAAHGSRRFAIDAWQPSAVTRELLLEANGDLYVAAAKGAALRRLTDTAAVEADAQLSPDGSRVAFVRAGDLVALELETGKETRLTVDGRPPAVVNGARPGPAQPVFPDGMGFAWAPDNRTLAFLRSEDGALQLWEVNVVAPPARRFETGPAADGVLTEAEWRSDVRALGVERRSPAGDRYTFLLCQPERMYCRRLAERAASPASTPRRDLWFLGDGFYWSPLAAREGLARFDTLGRQRVEIARGTWRFEDLLAEDERSGRLLLAATRTGPGRATERALLALPAGTLEPEPLAVGEGLDFTVSPTGTRFVAVAPATDRRPRRELRSSAGELVAVLDPPQ